MYHFPYQEDNMRRGRGKQLKIYGGSSKGMEELEMENKLNQTVLILMYLVADEYIYMIAILRHRISALKERHRDFYS